jgi:nucleoside 2-deoxyribosyltransferase
MKVYLAGPEVFLPDATAIGQRKKDICARFGLVGLFPLDNDRADAAAEDGAPASLRIFRACMAMMEDADAVIAHLTPFRGPSADPGTVYEPGFMAARGKVCAGYSNCAARYSDRVERAYGVAAGGGVAGLDRDGHVIENFGLSDNLMIIHALEQFGHPVIVPETAPADIWRDLTLFETCAEWVAQWDRA